jgi:hypothetical protein
LFQDHSVWKLDHGRWEKKAGMLDWKVLRESSKDMLIIWTGMMVVGVE